MCHEFKCKPQVIQILLYGRVYRMEHENMVPVLINDASQTLNPKVFIYKPYITSKLQRINRMFQPT
jgi:hypothetical protein